MFLFVNRYIIIRVKKVVVIIRENQFENYIKQYQRLIITICFSFTKNYFDAEDIAQQTFLTAYKNMNKFDGRNFKAWVTKIALNKCRDYVKSPAVKLESLSREDYKYVEDIKESPEESLLNKDSDEKIYNLCRRLKEPYRDVAVNYFCENIKLSDMAKDTGKI